MLSTQTDIKDLSINNTHTHRYRESESDFKDASLYFVQTKTKQMGEKNCCVKNQK